MGHPGLWIGAEIKAKLGSAVEGATRLNNSLLLIQHCFGDARHKLRRPMLKNSIIVMIAVAFVPFARASDDQIALSVTPTSQHSCAADRDIARITIDLTVILSNSSKSNLIISKTAKNPVPLRPQSGIIGNLDEFPATAPKTISVTPRPSNSFRILRPGDRHEFKLHGWILVSRTKAIAGTVGPGTLKLVGVLDPWPYDSSNSEVLKKQWMSWGDLQFSSLVLPPFSVRVVVPNRLELCTGEK
jgi:hypothetical protein